MRRLDRSLRHTRPSWCGCERLVPQAGSLSRRPRGVRLLNSSFIARVLAGAGILIGCALFSGCGPGKTAKDAEKVIARYFQAIATNDYTAAMADYSPLAYQEMTAEQWVEMQAKKAAKLGTYVSHAPKLFRVTRGGTRATRARTTVVIICQVTYSKRSAKETFTLVRQDTYTLARGRVISDFKIVDHNVSLMERPGR